MYWCYATAEAITLRKNDVPYDELITKPVSKNTMMKYFKYVNSPWIIGYLAGESSV